MTGAASETPALRTTRVRLTGAVLLLLLGLALALDLAAWLPLQSAWFDTLQRLHPRVAQAAAVTIVEIDETSLKQLGPWPWPRTKLAQLIHAVNGYGPRAIGVDIVMPEPDPLSPERALAHVDIDAALLERLGTMPSNDTELASAFKAAPTVVVLAGLPEKSAEAPRVSRIVVSDTNGRPDAARAALAQLIRFPGALSNLAALNDAASGWGLISVDTRQGVIRRVPLVANVNGAFAPAFALEMWRVAARASELKLITTNGFVDGVGIGERVFGVESDGSARLYFSRPDPDRSVSAYDVLSGSVAPERLHRPYVLIGVTALALGDSLSTPLGDKLPGVALHAQVLENMQDGAFLTSPPWATVVEAMMLFVTGALLLWVTPRWPVRLSAAIAMACVAALLAGSYGLFRSNRLLFDAATPAVSLLVLFATLLALTLADATRNRKALQRVVQLQREESARVAGELQAARRIQMDTLPRPESIDDARIELAASMEPAQEVGGDLYDFYRLDERRLFFMLGDVAGHGLPASIFMAVSKALCKSTMLRARDADLGAFLSAANVEVTRENPAALFVTVFAGVLDLESGDIAYCNAGHENPWIVHAAGGSVRRLTEGGGPPLCVIDDFVYRSAHARLQRGDLVCVVSDGVTEASDPARALYGTARIERALPGIGSAREVVEALRNDVKAFAAGTEPADDMTVLALRWRGPLAVASA